MKKWVILLYVLLLLPSVARAEEKPQECDKLYDSTWEEVKKLNYCSSDDDCTDIHAFNVATPVATCLGPIFLNKNADTTFFQRVEDSYIHGCSVYHGPPPPCPYMGKRRDESLRCVDKKCKYVSNCGNGVCDPEETSETCLQDCAPITGLNCNQIKEQFDTQFSSISSCSEDADCKDILELAITTWGINPSCHYSGYDIHKMTEQLRRNLVELTVAYKRQSCLGSGKNDYCRGTSTIPKCIAGMCQTDANGTRRGDIEMIEFALINYYNDHNHVWPKGISEVPKEICSANSPDHCRNMVNLNMLVGKYLSAIPKDPSYTGNDGSHYFVAITHYNYEGYYAKLNKTSDPRNSHIIISAPDAKGEKISVGQQ